MKEEERVMVRVVYAVKELEVLKRLAMIVESERRKVGNALEAQIVAVAAAKDDLVALVFSGMLDIQKTVEVQGMIKHLNTILDVETNRKACVGVN